MAKTSAEHVGEYDKCENNNDIEECFLEAVRRCHFYMLWYAVYSLDGDVRITGATARSGSSRGQ